MTIQRKSKISPGPTGDPGILSCVAVDKINPPESQITEMFLASLIVLPPTLPSFNPVVAFLFPTMIETLKYPIDGDASYVFLINALPIFF